MKKRGTCGMDAQIMLRPISTTVRAMARVRRSGGGISELPLDMVDDARRPATMQTLVFSDSCQLGRHADIAQGGHDLGSWCLGHGVFLPRVTSGFLEEDSG